MSTTTAVKERPILFRGEMVRAILDGRKTMTRRVVKGEWVYYGETGVGAGWEPPKCPYGVEGDRLWVRETWQAVPVGELRDWQGIPAGRFRLPEPNRPSIAAIYRADGPMPGDEIWRPSIFMPREACRLVLEITDVRVEQLDDISEEDAYAEGVTIPSYLAFASNGNPELRNEARCVFQTLWESINGVGSWAANPFVWVVSFRRVEL